MSHHLQELKKNNIHSHKTMLVVFWLNFSFFIIELIAAYIADSLALFSDCMHMLSDLAAIVVALIAGKLASIKSSSKFPYGFVRLPIVAGIINVIGTFIIALFIILEAIQRFNEQVSIKAIPVIIVGCVGFFINIISAWWLHKCKDKGLNVKAVTLHMFADALGSLAALISGIVLFFSQWIIVDAIVSILIVVIIIIGAIPLLYHGVSIIMQRLPKNISYSSVVDDIMSDNHVTSIVDLKIWELDSKINVATAALKTNTLDLKILNNRAESIKSILVKKYDIIDITIEWSLIK